jgi:hypothetical protein
MRLALLVCLLSSTAFAETLPDPAAFTKGLPEPYRAKQSTPKAPPWATGATQIDRQLYDSGKAVKKTKLRFQLTVYEHATPEAAKATVDKFLATANPDWGHSYAFDHVFATGTRAIHLWVPCAYSNKRADELATRARRWAAAVGDDAVQCRCGGGCKAVKVTPGGG